MYHITPYVMRWSQFTPRYSHEARHALHEFIGVHLLPPAAARLLAIIIIVVVVACPLPAARLLLFQLHIKRSCHR